MTVYVSSPQIPAVLTFEDESVDEINTFIGREMSGYLDLVDEETANQSEIETEVRHGTDGEQLYFLKRPPAVQTYDLEHEIFTIDWGRVAGVRIAETAPDHHLPAGQRLPRLPQVRTDIENADKPIFVTFPDEG
jgi:hypothetical protein